MEYSPGLVSSLRQGMPLTMIGNAGLPKRMGRLLVLARSDGRRVHLAASFLGPVSRPKGVSDSRFAFSRGPLSQLVLSAGSWPGLVPVLAPRSRPIAAGEIEPALRRFCEMVDLTAGTPFELTLSPDGQRVDSAVEGLNQLFSKLRDLATAGGGGSRPGQVYQPPADDPTAVNLADIGGLEAAKTELETICLAVRDPAAFSAWGSRPPRGVLLYGPPGTGKTMLARALAREANARFIHVRATDVVSKWYGEAERKLQEAFDWAKRERPSVLFFDEIDALAPDREGAHEATHRLVTTFLENMDGMRTAEGVIVVAATNRPEQVDRALTRSGRFDRLVEVPMPDGRARRQIFEIHLKRAAREAGRNLFEPLEAADWKRLIDLSAGFSGADIAEVVRHALESKVRAGARRGVVTAEELLAEVGATRRPF